MEIYATHDTKKPKYKLFSKSRKIGIVMICLSAYIELVLITNCIPTLRNFFIGVFGLFAYILFAFTLIMGICLVKEVEFYSVHKQNIIVILVGLYSILCIFNMSFCGVPNVATVNFGEYISQIYSSNYSSIGGILSVITIYPIIYITDTVSAYVIYSIMFIVCLASSIVLFDRYHIKTIKNGVYTNINGDSDNEQSNITRDYIETLLIDDRTKKKTPIEPVIQVQSQKQDEPKKYKNNLDMVINEKDNTPYIVNTRDEVLTSIGQYINKTNTQEKEIKKENITKEPELTDKQKKEKLLENSIDKLLKTFESLNKEAEDDNGGDISNIDKSFLTDFENIINPSCNSRKNSNNYTNKENVNEMSYTNNIFDNDVTDNNINYSDNDENYQDTFDYKNYIYNDDDDNNYINDDDNYLDNDDNYLTNENNYYNNNNDNNDNNNYNNDNNNYLDNEDNYYNNTNNNYNTSNNYFDDSKKYNNCNNYNNYVTYNNQTINNFNNNTNDESSLKGFFLDNDVERNRKPYIKPDVNKLLKDNEKVDPVTDEYCNDIAKRIENVLREGYEDVEVVRYTKGIRVTRFEVRIPIGKKMSNIRDYKDALKASIKCYSDIDIQLPLPGKDLVGIDVPNNKEPSVSFKELVTNSEFTTTPYKDLFVVGKNIYGDNVYERLDNLVHALVAGTTGSGKSVFLNTLITSLICNYGPEDLRILIIDPKLVDFNFYIGIPHMLIPEPIDNDPEKIIKVLKITIEEMEKRYKTLRSKGLQKIEEYNNLPEVKSGKLIKMPKILIVFDEFADVITGAPAFKKEIEGFVQRLGGKARACGICLILSTQKPTVNIVTGVIKANLPSRFAFKVDSNVDSRIIIEKQGAENLLGKGDMLYKGRDIQRLQSSWISGDEIRLIVKDIREKNAESCIFNSNLLNIVNNNVENFNNGMNNNNNNKCSRKEAIEALRILIKSNSVSTSNLQSRMSIGYPKAVKIMNTLIDNGYAERLPNSKYRLLITKEDFSRIFNEEL